jgi:hypothetical protein
MKDPSYIVEDGFVILLGPNKKEIAREKLASNLSPLQAARLLLRAYERERDRAKVIGPPELQIVTIQVRPPKGTFPGEVAQAKFADMGDGTVQLFSMTGKSYGRKLRDRIPESWTAREKASRMLRAMTSSRSNDFNRRLTYPEGF